MTWSTNRRIGFSLVELVVVIVIIGILAAIAVPRLSRGSAGASQSALTANLSLLRNAIHIYAAEHNSVFPGPDAAAFANQLTMFSSYTGATQATKDNTHKYGPYLVSIPPCPVGENAGKPTATEVLIDNANSPPVPNPGGGQGWVYNPTTGEILPNTNMSDDAGVPFKSY